MQTIIISAKNSAFKKYLWFKKFVFGLLVCKTCSLKAVCVVIQKGHIPLTITPCAKYKGPQTGENRNTRQHKSQKPYPLRKSLCNSTLAKPTGIPSATRLFLNSTSL